MIMLILVFCRQFVVFFFFLASLERDIILNTSFLTKAFFPELESVFYCWQILCNKTFFPGSRVSLSVCPRSF